MDSNVAASVFVEQRHKIGEVTGRKMHDSAFKKHKSKVDIIVRIYITSIPSCSSPASNNFFTGLPATPFFLISSYWSYIIYQGQSNLLKVISSLMSPWWKSPACYHWAIN